MNDGNCSSTLSGFTCLCNRGFTGLQCEENIDECGSNTCAAGATCMDGIDHFTCLCPPGFTGLTCSDSIDECASQPCLNGGTCVEDEVAGFECLCLAGSTGTLCETPFDLCTLTPCFNNGTCTGTDGGFECACPPGWTGRQCQFPLSVSTKLASCGFDGATDVFWEILNTTDSVAFTRSSAPVEINYSLSSEMLYFSSWVWQEEETVGTIFSLTSSTTDRVQVGVVSDPEFSEVTLYYTSTGMGESELTITNTPLTPAHWHHVALTISNTTFSLSVDNHTMFDRSVFNLLLPTSVNLTIGGGGTKDEFIGIMRGASLYDGRVDLSSVEGCLVGCVGGGDGYCQNGGVCFDQFSPQYYCSCTFGYSGPFCQYQNHRISFERGGSASPLGQHDTLSSVELDFKSGSAMGQIVSHTSSTFSTFVGVTDTILHVNFTYCDSQTQAVALPAPRAGDGNWHSLSLSYTPEIVSITLDDNDSSIVPLLNVTGCNTQADFPLVLGGTTDQPPIDGCVRNVILDSLLLQSSELELREGAQFGCRRDTAQFFGQSFLLLPQFLSPDHQTISLFLNTRSSEGVVYYSHRTPGDATGENPLDFLALHLSSGRLSLSYNLGESTTTISVPAALNDGQWHYVEASLNGTMGVLSVDGESQQGMVQGPLNMLDTTASVLVGGVPVLERVTSFSEYTSYNGCVQELEQNGDPVDLQSFMASQNVRFGTCN